jgi:hypothetical protein
MAVSFRPSEPLGNFLNELSAIGTKGQYHEQMKLPAPKAPTALRSFQGLPAGVGPKTSVTGGTGGIRDVPGDLGRLMRAIGGQESGNNYAAVNRDSGAMGKYQILPSNIQGSGRGWDYEALGRDITTQQFMASPQLQEQIAQFKLGQYLKSRGMAGAAATWYGGDWGYKNMYNKKPQAGYPSMYDYVMSVINRA